MSKKQLTIVITVLAVIVAGAAAWVATNNKPQTSSQPVAHNSSTVPSPTPEQQDGAEPTTTPEVITSDIDTSDWKTYRNEEYNYLIRYPQDLFTLENILDPNYLLDPKRIILFHIPSSLEVKKCNCGEAASISIAILPNEKKLSLEEFFIQRYNFEFLSYKKTENFNDQLALSFGTERENYVIFTHADNMVELYWTGGDFRNVVNTLIF
jgi:hypothetical protein